MKISSIATPSFLVLALACANLVAAAALAPKDKGEFTLKNGKVLKGEIVRMQGDAYVIEFQPKPGVGIKDQMIVPVQDVVKSVLEKPDEQEFAKLEIAKMTPTPDMLTVEEYDQRIAKVKGFITKFPKSAKLKEAGAILKTLTDEREEVAAGGRKLQGGMIKAADYRANAFELDARVLDAKIRVAAKTANWLAALRAFAELDKEYQSAACYRDVLPVVVTALQQLRLQLAPLVEGFEAHKATHDADLQKMPVADREYNQRADEAEQARLERIYQQEKSSEQPWVTWNANHKQSLEDDKSLAESELQRLKTPLPKVPDGGKVFRNAWKVIHSGANAEAMDKALADAEAAALPERYLKMLQDAVKASGVKPKEEQ